MEGMGAQKSNELKVSIEWSGGENDGERRASCEEKGPPKSGM